MSRKEVISFALISTYKLKPVENHCSTVNQSHVLITGRSDNALSHSISCHHQGQIQGECRHTASPTPTSIQHKQLPGTKSLKNVKFPHHFPSAAILRASRALVLLQPGCTGAGLSLGQQQQQQMGTPSLPSLPSIPHQPKSRCMEVEPTCLPAAVVPGWRFPRPWDSSERKGEGILTHYRVFKSLMAAPMAWSVCLPQWGVGEGSGGKGLGAELQPCLQHQLLLPHPHLKILDAFLTITKFMTLEISWYLVWLSKHISQPTFSYVDIWPANTTE